MIPLRGAESRLGQTEAVFTAAVIEFARARGWLVHHDRPARTKKGWVTAIQGDKGFPDLVMLRGDRIVVAELKGIGPSGKRAQKPKDDQAEWLGMWVNALWPLRRKKDGGSPVYVWWPDDDWQEVLV